MRRIRCESSRSLLMVVDVQPTFLQGMDSVDQVVARCEFLVRAAHVLNVPVIATEQVPHRMGGTHEALAPLISPDSVFGKSTFSALGAAGIEAPLHGVRQVVLVGIETHICISQTAHDLMDTGIDVVVASDAIQARSLSRHEIGLVRLRHAGAVTAHTESVVYEWMQSAQHERFRDVLALVKRFGVA